jgi:hypothetical protein
MKKILTITWDTNTGSMISDWGEGVTADDAVSMCEFALGEAECALEEEDSN